MRFQIDHDLPIHSQISLCSKDPEQTPESILAYGEKEPGIDLNMSVENVTGENRETTLRPYRIAKAEGGKFYLGSDAHHPARLDGAMARFNAIIDALDLTEDDKFHIVGI